MLQGFFKGVICVLQGSYKGVLMALEGCNTDVTRGSSRLFQWCQLLQGCYKDVSRVFQACYTCVMRVAQRYFMGLELVKHGCYILFCKGIARVLKRFYKRVLQECYLGFKRLLNGFFNSATRFV